VPDDATLPEPEDGVVRALGVVLPIPDGWVLDRALYDDGMLGASPDQLEPDQLVIAAAGIEDHATFGVAGLDLDGAIDHFRELLPGAPDQDEPIEVDGAERAHLLRFDDLELEPGADRSHEVVVLADDGDGELALFNYAATADGLDEEVLELVLEGIGYDPDSEPPEIEEPTNVS
jgi:hypothetical protein